MIPGDDSYNKDKIQVLSEDIVNKAGRTGGTFLHTSRTRPSHVPRDFVPKHLKEKYNNNINDLTPEILKNLDYLGIDYLKSQMEKRGKNDKTRYNPKDNF